MPLLQHEQRVQRLLDLRHLPRQPRAPLYQLLLHHAVRLVVLIQLLYPFVRWPPCNMCSAVGCRPDRKAVAGRHEMRVGCKRELQSPARSASTSSMTRAIGSCTFCGVPAAPPSDMLGVQQPKLPPAASQYQSAVIYIRRDAVSGFVIAHAGVVLGSLAPEGCYMIIGSKAAVGCGALQQTARLTVLRADTRKRWMTGGRHAGLPVHQPSLPLVQGG
jgi:septum formation inhibitor MinC